MICKNTLFYHKWLININNFDRMVLAPCHQILIILPTQRIYSTVYLNALSWLKFGGFDLLSLQFSFRLGAEIGERFFRKFPYLNTWKLLVFGFQISFDKISWCRRKNFIWNRILSQNIPAVNLVRKIFCDGRHHLHFVFVTNFKNFEIRIWLFTTRNNIFFTSHFFGFQV